MKNISNNFSKKWGYKVVSVYHPMRLQLKVAWLAEIYYFFSLCIWDRMNLFISEVHLGLNFQINLDWRLWRSWLGNLPSLPDQLHFVIRLLLTCLTFMCPQTVLFADLGLCMSLGCWFSAVTSLWCSLKSLCGFFFIFSWLICLFLSHGCLLFFSSTRDELIVNCGADLNLSAAWIEPISFFPWETLKINVNSTEVIQKVTRWLPLFKIASFFLSLCFSSSPHDFVFKA